MASLEYLAGFFDGEGYIGATSDKTNHRYALRVTVSNNDPVGPSLYVQVFGGKVLQRKQKGKLIESWFWIAHGKMAQLFLKAIRPYLILKAKEADLALTFPITDGGKRLSHEQRQKQKRLYDQLIAIKTERSQLDVREREWEWDGGLLDRVEVRRAIELYQSGLTQEKVAESINSEFGLNVKYSHISYWLRSTGNNISRSQAHIRQHSKTELTDSQRLAAQLYSEGMSSDQIAAQLGVSDGTVYYWLKKQGATRTLQNAQHLRWERERDHIKNAEALRRYKAGDTIKSIARDLKTSSQTIIRLARANGILRSMQHSQAN